MTAESENPGAADQGLAALVALLRFHGLGADPEQIRHSFGAKPIGVAEMLRCAKELGMKARAVTTRWERLVRTPMPAIATLRDGRFLILGKVSDQWALVQSPVSPRPQLLSREEFEAVWDGRLVLTARRAGLADLGRRFDVTWFLGAIHKYRHLLGEVLVASFFLQLFALVSPLFFQVVIDKVLVHRTLSTLDVLVIGLIAIGIFEAILGGLRTYLFAHSTNRLDEKFRRGAENQAFLVETVNGVETLKAMAVEPQMQRRWEEQLAGYVSASFRVIALGNTANQAVQLISKLVTALTLYFGAILVIDGSLSVGELVAFTMLSGRVTQPVLRLAQLWQDFHQARLSIARLGDILNSHPEPAHNPSRSTLPTIAGDVTFERVLFRYRADRPT